MISLPLAEQRAARSVPSRKKYSISAVNLHVLCTIGIFPRRNNTFLRANLRAKTKGSGRIRSPSYVKGQNASQPFANGAVKESPIIFFGDMCGEENTSQAASVEFVRRRRTNYARSRLQPFCREITSDFPTNEKGSGRSRSLFGSISAITRARVRQVHPQRPHGAGA